MKQRQRKPRKPWHEHLCQQKGLLVSIRWYLGCFTGVVGAAGAGLRRAQLRGYAADQSSGESRAAAACLQGCGLRRKESREIPRDPNHSTGASFHDCQELFWSQIPNKALVSDNSSRLQNHTATCLSLCITQNCKGHWVAKAYDSHRNSFELSLPGCFVSLLGRVPCRGRRRTRRTSRSSWSTFRRHCFRRPHQIQKLGS